MRASVFVVPAYLLATLAITWPVAREFATALPAVFNAVDPLLQAFILGWDRHAFATGILHIFDAPIFHPELGTLAYMDHLMGEALVSAPVAAVTGSAAAAYNAALLAAFVTSGWASYRLARALGASRAAAFVAGLLYLVAPYRLSNLGNLNQLHTEFVPVTLLFALRFAARGRTRDLAWLFGALVLQSYFGWYSAFHVAVALAITLACARVFRWPAADPLPWRRIAVGSALALVAMLPGALPYWLQHVRMPGFHRTLGKAVLYSADLVDYVRVNRENVLARTLHLPRGDLACALGLPALALVVAQLWPRREPPEREPLGLRRFWTWLAWIAAAGFVLSLGPILNVAGHHLRFPLPYAVLYFTVPGFSGMRAPERFTELVLLAAVIAAAFGYDRLRAGLAGTARGAARAALFAGTIALAIAGAWSAPIPMVVYPTRASMPAAYEFLARQPGRFAILELPMPAREADETDRDVVRQIWGLYHGKPRADGVSGFSSPAQESFRALMRSFPDPITVSAIVERDVRYVVVRYGEYEPQEAARIRYEIAGARELTPVFTAGSDVVYQVTKSDLQAINGIPHRARGRVREARSQGPGP